MFYDNQVMGTDSEQEKLDELMAWTLNLADQAFIHQHVVDAWAAQHADQPSKPISIAFALMGLYLYLEKGFTGRQVQRVHMQLAQPRGSKQPRKHWPEFMIPRERGEMTVLDVMAAPERERMAAIRGWCVSVWNAWRHNHEQVRNWAAQDLGFEEALGAPRSPLAKRPLSVKGST